MIYELRIYTAAQGRMPDLLARFRDHTVTIFERHGMKNIGYWLNTVGGRSDELWYMLAYESMAARESAWESFMADEEWRRIRAESEVDGPLVSHAENRFMAPTDFSPLS